MCAAHLGAAFMMLPPRARYLPEQARATADFRQHWSCQMLSPVGMLALQLPTEVPSEGALTASATLCPHLGQTSCVVPNAVRSGLSATLCCCRPACVKVLAVWLGTVVQNQAHCWRHTPHAARAILYCSADCILAPTVHLDPLTLPPHTDSWQSSAAIRINPCMQTAFDPMTTSHKPRPC